MSRRRRPRPSEPLIPDKPFNEMSDGEFADYRRDMDVRFAAHRRNWQRSMFVQLAVSVGCFGIIALGLQGVFPFTPVTALLMVPSLAVSAWGFTRAIPTYVQHRDGLDSDGHWIGPVPWPMVPGRIVKHTMTITLDQDGRPEQIMYDRDGDRSIHDITPDDDDE